MTDIDRSGPEDEAVTAWARLIRASQHLLEKVEADLKAAGLPPLIWYDALLELRRAGRAGLRPVDLQHRMLLAQYNVSRLVDRLEAAGYLQRERLKSDGRAQVLFITTDGRKLLKAMWPVYRSAIDQHFTAPLSGKKIRQISKIMTAFLPAG
ncbi:MAG: MarR family winged helix-turn-helix transcriptional regulator [Rhodospirillales bacterium]